MIEIKLLTKSPYKAIKYLNKLKINIYNIKYQKDGITLKISLKDLNKINKYYNIEIIREYGKQNIKKQLNNQKISIIYFIIILSTIFFMTRIIIDIQVITGNINLKSHILNELDKQGITKYTTIKDNKTLNNIKEIILSNNKDLLEWLNIERIGMKYVINLEPKVTKSKQEKQEYCNIISTKDSIITRIITSKGEEVVNTNDSVKKGDLLISGSIKYNEELKKQVCASGIVYGTTWYTINITIPKTKEILTKKEKNRYNILFKYNNRSYKLFKSRISNYQEENKKIINIFGIEIYLSKEYEVEKNIIELTSNEQETIIEEKTNEALSHTLNKEYKILDRKVLKKQANDSKIELELFIVAEEQISTTIYE